MPSLLLRNDNLLYVLGLIDDLDPVNTDGSPKWINTVANLAWEIRTAAAGAGSLVASGTGQLVTTGPLKNAGNYYAELSKNISFSGTDYLHVTGDAGAYHFDLEDTILAVSRTGRTSEG